MNVSPNLENVVLKTLDAHLPQNRFKILVCGGEDVGKSCLIKRIVEKTFDDEKIERKMLKSILRNIGNDIAKIDMEEVDLDHLMSKNPGLPRRYWLDVKALYFLYDTADRSTFEHLQKQMPVVQRIAPPDCMFVLIGTKSDLMEKQVTWDEAVNYSEHQQLSLFEISSKNGINCEHVLFETIDAIFERQEEEREIEEDKETIENQPIYQDTTLPATNEDPLADTRSLNLFCWVPKIPFFSS